MKKNNFISSRAHVWVNNQCFLVENIDYFIVENITENQIKISNICARLKERSINRRLLTCIITKK